MITSTQYTIKRHQFILALLFLFSVCSYAQLKHEFEPRFNEPINGDFAMIANNTVSVFETIPYLGPLNNNNYSSLNYVDIDNDDSTFSSSNATFKAPINNTECLTIKKVFLYWTAVDHEPGTSPPSTENRPDWNFNDIKLMLPTQPNYNTLTADEVIYRGRDDNGDGIADDHFGFDPYVCFKDITNLVNTELIDKNISPYDTYQVANVEATLESFSEHGLTNNANGAGGWQIVFVYESPTLPLKNVTIFDGYAHVNALDSDGYEVEITGFNTVPAPQDVNVDILFGGIEGDRGFSGDRLQILPPSATDFEDLTTSSIAPIRSGNNFFNSRITIDNDNFIDRTPASTNTLGFDAGIFKLINTNNDLIGNDQTSTTLKLLTTNESYGLYLLGLSVEVFEPKLGPIEVTTNVSNTPQAPGASITGEFVVENKGNDDAENVKIFSTLPPQLTIENFSSIVWPAGVSASYNSASGYLEFTVEDAYVTTTSPPLNVDFELTIKDECYFLQENCQTSFGIQFTATYNGKLNPETQTTTSSSEVECGLGNNEETIVNVIQPTVEWQTAEDSLNRTIQCNDSDGLTEAQALSPEANKCTFTPTKTAGSFVEDATCSTGTYTNTWTFTDACGETISAFTQIITIENSTPIVLPEGGAETVNCLADATETFTIPTVTDVCGNTITPSGPVITESPTPFDCEGTKTYTYTFTDCSNVSYEWAYVYTISVPTFTIPDVDGALTVECITDADGTDITLPIVQDACGNELTASTPVISDSSNPFNCEGTRTYTYTFTDCSGHNVEWAFVYTIELNTFTLPANGSETVGSINDAVEPTPPTVMDNCGNEITPSEPTISNLPDCEGSVVYTFTYVDCANNSANWTYTYNIELTPFTVPAHENSTVECLAEATVPTPPTVNDANGTEITPVMTQSTTPICEGAKTYTFTYTDCADNTGIWEYTYNIDTVTLPTVPTNDSSTVTCLAEATQPTAPEVTDFCGNTIAPVITQSADPDCEGQKIYTFTYTDCANNESVYTYTYNIDLSTAPTVPVNAETTVQCLADATQPTAPEVTDACGNAIVPVITQNADPICEGQKIYTFTYTDCANNESIYTYTYNIDLTTAPIVPENAESTVECLADATQPTAPNVNDACGTAIVPVITESVDPNCEGQKIYTFTYTDCASNEAVYTYTYNIDLTAFILPTNGTETVDSLNDVVEPTPPTVNDNCGNEIIPSEPVKSATPDCEGSVVYTFTYTDCANNSANWTYTYNIELAPFTLPANESSTVECLVDATVPTSPTVNDANGTEVIPVMTQSTDPDCEGDKIYTFTYTDCAGNTGIWEYTYTINTETLPTVPTNDSSTVQCLAEATQPTAPSVNDACGNVIDPVITASTDPDCEGQKIYTFTYTDC
ncbi:MAG: hypothetical protein ABJM36_00220, partial [Algibacter sp.]|uniref:HYR-like domain-containing protein n=1 Tax=Algibacter sp. TaxID=1872428 RepID=UPI0032990590